VLRAFERAENIACSGASGHAVVKHKRPKKMAGQKSGHFHKQILAVGLGSLSAFR